MALTLRPEEWPFSNAAIQLEPYGDRLILFPTASPGPRVNDEAARSENLAQAGRTAFTGELLRERKIRLFDSCEPL
ncbi:hypothetical protein [Paenibacillus mucilaginosus]|uniref:Uncharacterized protein n=1 Tax=Paenibacillus mucilaginosus (strain KNP414) TaxID=1036673 RepID=F8F4Q2_PAEMK|nr:hypothetical protein [Paenibacillus mucilaginosus]AEI39444.1 hypothetical protein KNP414_00854 [Paenibacillus mucilaginosus KNP414]MCG7214723.1 hypothetical protein [Paenibacillus mucilaginosus]WDM28417.1 hypothetical protein KCX80_04015 [Paenibacillus mucilaginosus]